jgi:ankyrin repeat protein
MSKSLPARANLEQLKNQAKDLLKALHAGEPAALQRIREHHPDRRNATESQLRAAALNDAQLAIAREYGFQSWPRLKHELDRRAHELSADASDPTPLFKQAFADDDAAAFAKLLNEYPQMKARIDEPVAAFNSPIITQVRSREMLDVLLAAGADINARSRWWAGGFGLLDSAAPDLAAYAIERGAVVDAHAAARLGMTAELQRLIGTNPELVHARGGDGQTPLHFAKTVEIAEYLLQQGARIDALDVDHESTPAQYMVRDRQAVARYLVERGCRTDLLMAAALGDLRRAREHLDSDPACIRMNVSDQYFPRRNPHSGGTIYTWTLGQNKSPHAIAREFGHEDILALLLERSPETLKLTVAFELEDKRMVEQLLAARVDLMQSLPEADRPRLADAAQNNKTRSVDLMLAAGWPAGVRGRHGATPLHWAAFHGNREMAETILRYSPPLEWIDADFQGTPLRWAVYGSEHGWYCKTGDYAGTVEALLEAGAKHPGKIEGTEAVQKILRQFQGGG